MKYLANLESADEQNYERLFGEEYIKKSDVLEIFKKEDMFYSKKHGPYSMTARVISDITAATDSLPTINLSVIDEMIEESKKMSFGGEYISGRVDALDDLREHILSPNK